MRMSLTTEQAIDIKQRYMSKTATAAELAKTYGVTPTTIYRVLHGKLLSEAQVPGFTYEVDSSKSRRLSNEVRQSVKSDILSGMKYVDVAAKYNVSPSAVSYYSKQVTVVNQ